MRKIDKDHFRGVLLGGSIGDAAGFGQILDKKWLVSDNTQLTSFTLDGLAWADNRAKKKGIYAYIPSIFYSYQKWYYTQTGNLSDDSYKFILGGELLKWDELYARRGTGVTTLTALKNAIKNNFGSKKNPPNDSNFCGAVMRSAPIGMYFYDDIDSAYRFGMEAAYLTHGGDEGVLAPAFFSYMMALILNGFEIKEAAIKGLEKLREEEFTSKKLIKKIEDAILFTEKKEDYLTVLEKIGKGFIASEAIAISVFLSISFQDDFDRMLKFLANYEGNNDSIGSITGNLIGGYIGLNNLPFKKIIGTELSELMVFGADILLEKVLNKEV